MILLKIHVSGKFLKFMTFPTLSFFPSPPPLTLSVVGELTNTHSTFSCQIPGGTCQPWLSASCATCQFIPQGLWDYVHVVSPHCQQTPCNTQTEAEPFSDLTTHFRSWLCFIFIPRKNKDKETGCDHISFWELFPEIVYWKSVPKI